MKLTITEFLAATKTRWADAMHKLKEGTGDGSYKRLSAVVTYSDRDYQALGSGQFVRMNPKPYGNKAEMKAQKRARQVARTPF